MSEGDLAGCDLDRAGEALEAVAMLARYHRALEPAGVSGYPLEDLQAHCTEQLLLLLARMASVDLLDLGDQDGRGADSASVWIERLDARMARASSGRQ
ncbi:MAG: hypothetical protein OXN44_08010 [Acidimicrobiaceae bacterium]|nr:hypothetical protein [Acidimicrobiaceae bacterium]